MPCKYSPVGPIKILEQLQGKDALGNYLLVLAHEVLADDIGYSFLLDSLLCREDKPSFIIMDNGVIERGKALPMHEVIDAADIAHVDCIVMPDILGDFEGTMKLVLAQLPKLKGCGYPIMKVPQGSDVSEVVRCIDWLGNVEFSQSKRNDEDYWGLPRWLANKFGSRKPFINHILSAHPNAKIHLLGMSHNWIDDVLCARMRNVIGIDSANPIVRGLLGHLMKFSEPVHVDRGEYWAETEINERVLDNIAYVREALT